jgi:hypothetical protein
MNMDDHKPKPVEILRCLAGCKERNIEPPGFAVEYLSNAIAAGAGGKHE